MPYQLTFEQRPAYVHTKVVGERTPENMLRFLRDSYTACVNIGRNSVLLEFQLSGPGLSTTSIFDVISAWAADAKKLHKVAYVDGSPVNVAMPAFAVTVAVNRGVNMRLFGDVASAANWLSQEEHDPGKGILP